jgi:phage terminase large subunit
MVYAMGLWGVLGKTVFDKEKVTKRMAEIINKKPLKQGYFTFDYENEKIVDSTITWCENSSGPIKIYCEVEKGHSYVAGGDTAGDGSDMFTGHFINNSDEEQVAVLTVDTDETEYVRQMYCLGKYYNYALLGIETNYSTYPVKELARLGYTKQFSRVQEDTYEEYVESRFGFHTNKKTRPLIISGLVNVVKDAVENINDLDTLKEMLSFVRNEKKKGRMEAEQGAHDDHVMGLAIAYYVAQTGQQRNYVLLDDDRPKPKKLIDTLKLQTITAFKKKRR